MSDFLKALIDKIVVFKNPASLTDEQTRIIQVFLDEISMIKPSPTFLPTSDDERLKKVIDILLNDISSKQNMDYFAKISCTSTRTLSRLFVEKLGMSFSDWRIRLKLMEAVKRLGEQHPVKEIAFDLGYENTSSFIQTFKKHFGQTPRNYSWKK